MGKLFSLSLLLLCMPAVALAAKPPSDLAAVEAEMARQKALESEMKRNAGAIKEEIGSLRKDMVKLAAKMRAKEDEAGELSRDISRLEAREAAAMKRLLAGRRQQEELAVALVRLGRLPPEVAFLGPGDVTDVVESAIILNGVEPELNRLAQAIEAELDEIQNVRADVVRKKKALDPVLSDLVARRSELDALAKKRQSSYDQFGKKRQEAKSAQDKLAKQAKDIRDLMARLETERKARVKKLIGADKVPSGSLPTALQPVSGQIIRFFGDDDAYGAPQQGISIKAPASGTVVAPLPGKVVFAGPFRSYKHLLIIEGAGGYHALLAGLAQITASVGEDVSKGEPLGTMGAAGHAAPELYFELRKDGAPVDPAWVLAAAGKRRK